MKLCALNAFTANGAGGNPAGVVLEADELSDTQMVAIAAKAGFSETAFVSKSQLATYKVRFFTPTEEVNLCGHATIATWSLLHRRKICGPGVYFQETIAGTLEVRVADDGLIFMEQAKPQFFETVGVDEIAPVLGLIAQDLSAELPAQVVSTGLKDLLVPLTSEHGLRAITPDMTAIAALSKKYNVTGLHVFCLLKDGNSITAARNFAPLVGIPEEAATGTSSGALLAYLRMHNNLPHARQHRMEQGRTMGQLSYIYGMFDRDTVWIGGFADESA